jgi:hypothetical protein
VARGSALRALADTRGEQEGRQGGALASEWINTVMGNTARQQSDGATRGGDSEGELWQLCAWMVHNECHDTEGICLRPNTEPGFFAGSGAALRELRCRQKLKQPAICFPMMAILGCF